MVPRIIRRLLGKRDTREECMKVRGLSSDYIDGELEQSMQDRIAKHLRLCAPCNAFIRTLKATVDMLRSTPRQEAPSDFRQRVHEGLRRERGQ